MGRRWRRCVQGGARFPEKSYLTLSGIKLVSVITNTLSYSQRLEKGARRIRLPHLSQQRACAVGRKNGLPNIITVDVRIVRRWVPKIKGEGFQGEVFIPSKGPTYLLNNVTKGDEGGGDG